MSWSNKKTINLRQTLAYVTDPAGSVGLAEGGAGTFNNPLYTPGANSNSPLTLDGDTFNAGWTANNDGARNRSTSVDPRIAGRQGWTAGSNTFEIQLGTQPGRYKIWLGITDQVNGTSGACSCTISDANGTLTTVTSASALTANQVLGADGTVYTNSAAWAGTADTTGVSITINSTDTSNGNGGPLLKFLCTTTTPLACVAVQFVAIAVSGSWTANVGVGTSVTCATHAPLIGDWIVAFATSNQGVPTFSTSTGDTFTVLPGYGPTTGTRGYNIYVGYVPNVAANTTRTLTATIPSSGQITVSAINISGLASSNALDLNFAATGTGTALSSGGSPTTVRANEILIGVGSVDTTSNLTWTAGSGFTQVSNASTGFSGSTPNLLVETQTVSATGSYTATATSTISGQWLQALLSFADTAINTGAPLMGRCIYVLP